MNPEAQLQLSSRLDPGEALLWADVPPRGVLLRLGDLWMIPFSLFWAGFSSAWMWSALTSGAPFFFWLLGTPFIAIGIYLVVGRFFLDAWIRAKTFYGLTDRRAIIISGIFSQSIRSLPLRTLTDVSLTERKDGRGTISFGRPHPYGAFYVGTPWPATASYTTPNFELIADAKRVYDKLTAAHRAAG